MQFKETRQMNNFGEKVSFIWSIADLIRDTFKRGKYQDVILPFTVLRRLDCVLEPTKVEVLAAYNQYKDKLDNLDPLLCKKSGFAFYNSSRYDFSQDKAQLSQEYITRTVYDPCCGSGGMLTIAKDRILELNPKAEVFLFGQEVNPETFAVCKSDLYMKSVDGKDAENIKFGSTLSNDQHSDKTFDYLLANPPYGKDWKRDKEAVEAEAQKAGSRFSAGTPRISDGQLLFLQHMLSRMKAVEQGGSRVAIVMNGSPLFTGDAGSGESEIRRWILENDWLEAIVALPEQLFYNTGIATYVWVLTNHKSPQRKGKVQLINASESWVPMRKSLGSKRREISSEQIQEITKVFQDFESSEVSKIFDTEDFGYRKITVDRPLKLNFQASPERIERLKEQGAFANLAVSKKKNVEAKAIDEHAGREQQKLILAMLNTLSDKLYKDREQFEKVLKKTIKGEGLTIATPVYKAILAALSERDEMANICVDKQGNPEADSDLRDTENVPLKEDVTEYFNREVLPHVPDAWISDTVRDARDGEIGKVGYEINFNRYFYKYQPPRALEEIEADIKAVEAEILAMLREI
jgi:type I restriction enzyme M protein